MIYDLFNFKIKEICYKNGISLFRIREIGCSDYKSESIKKYVTPYNMKELNEAILFVVDFLNEKYGLKETISVDIDRDRTVILDQIFMSEKENSIANYCPEILEYWDEEKNGKLTPKQVSHASVKKIFLKCNLGHEWETTADQFSSHPWCPYCSGRRVWPGYNDLFTTNPELTQIWSTKNTIDPRTTKKGCNSKALWFCPKCGGEYSMSVKDKTSGQGCPYCSNRRVLKGYNDLKTIYPKLEMEWDYKKNTPLKPEDVTTGSNKKVWWKCQICGHGWQAPVCARTGNRRSGCPECGRKARKNPNAKAVIQLSLDGEFIAEYESAMEAERETGIKDVHAACRNERKTAGGYNWKYKD